MEENEIKNELNTLLSVSSDIKQRCFERGVSEHFYVRVRKRRKKIFSCLAMAAAIIIAITISVDKNITEAAEADGWLYVAGDAGNSRVVNTSVKRSLSDQESCGISEIAWRASVNSSNGAYKPLAWRGLIIAGHGQQKSGGGLTAFDAASGETRWSRSFKSGDFFKSKRFPDRCIVNGLLYISDGKSCMAIDPFTGNEVALFESGDTSGWSFLTADNNQLFGLSNDGKRLFAVNIKDGSSIWEKDFIAPMYVPALSGKVIYCHGSDGTVFAVNAVNGKDIWQTFNKGLTGKGYLQVKGDFLSVASENDCMALYNSKNGQLLWNIEQQGIFDHGAAISDSVVYLLGGAEALCASTGKVLWTKSDSTGTLCASPTLVDNYIVASSGLGSGYISIMGIDGSLLSTIKAFDSRACDGAIIFGGRIYTVGSGHIIAYGG